jgi:hypothetical protein
MIEKAGRKEAMCETGEEEKRKNIEMMKQESSGNNDDEYEINKDFITFIGFVSN